VRWIVVFSLTLVGCVASLPRDDGITADLACEAAREIVRVRQTIRPTPKNVCQSCDGTGKVGDGRIVMTCPVCKGTGKP
jgi:DnaJ-class molecular chaperone